MQSPPPTRSDLLAPLQRILHELEELASKAAVHRKKFEYSVSQLRRFIQAVPNSRTVVTPAQSAAHREIVVLLNQLRGLFHEHQLETWAHPTLEHHTNHVFATVITLCRKLKAACTCFVPSVPPIFAPDDPQWQQYHILDLQCISASFHQYLDGPNPDASIVAIIRERLDSIDLFIRQNEAGGGSPVHRVFSPIPVHYQQWKRDAGDFELISEIGHGTSSHVYFAIDRATSQEVAVKKLKCTTLAGQRLRIFQREVTVLACVNHRSLLQFIGATDTAPFYIVTEWMAGGNMFQELHKTRRLSQTQLSMVALDVALGMQFLHAHNIIHRDLKSLNVLLDKDGRAKICDFGVSRTLGDEDEGVMTQNIGTIHWMAPELLASNATYTSKVDVYAFGIFLGELVTRQIPFGGEEPVRIAMMVLVNDARPVLPADLNASLRDLIVHCWQRDPDRRPTFDEIVERFVRDKIALDGTDIAQFAEYVAQKTAGQSELTKSSVVFDIRNLDDDQSLHHFIEALETERIPIRLLHQCWDVIESKPTLNPVLVTRIAVLLFSTPLRLRAANLLRKLPVDSIPTQLISAALQVIPTGNEDFDRDLIIAACKNGAADLAAIYALIPLHVSLALEVVGQHGVGISLRAAVADKCVQALMSRDGHCVTAALRCLVGIGETRRIPPDVVLRFLRSGEETARLTGIIAGTQMALLGGEVTNEIVKTVMAGPMDDAARAFLVAACYRIHGGLYVVNQIVGGASIPPELALRILMMAVKNEEVRPAIQVALRMVDLSSQHPMWGREIEQLQQLALKTLY
jgi:serine/threonine protein kinase